MHEQDYQRVAAALEFLSSHWESQPDLETIAAQAGLSPFHFQRLFSRWAGISPTRFLGCLTLERAKQALRQGAGVLDASLEAGLSGPGRLHDLFVSHDATTPGAFKRGGEGLTIVHGIHPSPFGEALLATTPKGLCALEFLAPGEAAEALETLRNRWPEARLEENPARTAGLARQIFDPLARQEASPPLPLHLRGTNFQVRVWRALLEIPPGSVTHYRGLAERLGNPGLARAVGNALASNPLGLLIPCHRVIRGTGVLGEYRWGSARKRLILASEQAWMLAGREDAAQTPHGATLRGQQQVV